MVLGSLQIAKILAKTECCKHPKTCYLELQHLIHFDYHNHLLVTSPIQCTNDGMLHVPRHFVSFFQFENCVPKCYKKRRKFICEQLAKVSEIYRFINFVVLLISRKCNIMIEKMDLYKSGKVRACFCWITEKFLTIQINICFHDNKFHVNFF